MNQTRSPRPVELVEGFAPVVLDADGCCVVCSWHRDDIVASPEWHGEHHTQLTLPFDTLEDPDEAQAVVDVMAESFSQQPTHPIRLGTDDEQYGPIARND